MNTNTDFDRRASAWLADGPTELSDRVLDAALREVHLTHQRRRWSAPWRTPSMNTPIRLVAAIAIVALAAVAALLVGGATQKPSPPSPSPAAITAPGSILFGARDATTDRTTLRVIDPDGKDERALVEGDACCLVLSQNRRWLAYGIPKSGRVVPAVMTLETTFTETWEWTNPEIDAEISSATLNLLPRASGGSDPMFPDFAFEGWDDGQPDRTGIYLDVSDGGALLRGALVRLTSNPGTLHDVPLSFSPDSAKLLFIRDRDAGDDASGDLYVVNRDGSGLVRLSPEGIQVKASDAFGAGASWSPDGTRVAFSGFDTASTTTGSSRVYVVDAAGGPSTAVTEPGSYTTSARWSPDGSWIAFDRTMPTTNNHHVFLVHPDGTALADITPAADVALCCGTWSPDSKWFVAQGSVTAGDDSVGLFIVGIDGSSPVRVTTSSDEYRMWLTWSERIADQ